MYIVKPHIGQMDAGRRFLFFWEGGEGGGGVVKEPKNLSQDFLGNDCARTKLEFSLFFLIFINLKK